MPPIIPINHTSENSIWVLWFRLCSSSSSGSVSGQTESGPRSAVTVNNHSGELSVESLPLHSVDLFFHAGLTVSPQPICRQSSVFTGVSFATAGDRLALLLLSLNRFRHIGPSTNSANKMKKFSSLSTLINRRCSTTATTHLRRLSTKPSDGRDEWNDAWETAWLPEDLSGKNRAPWETDVNFSIADTPEALDPDTKAFVEDMSDNWEQRRKKPGSKSKREEEEDRLLKMKEEGKSLYSLENVKNDYRVMKQRVHASLWVKEIEKMEEAKLGDSGGAGGDDLDRFLDSASEIFDSGNNDLSNSEPTDLKNKPDGWETTSKTQDGNIWEMTQREEDILLQEYERRIAFSKFQIASFIKQHIFSRRRPVDGWKYMIEELGPNARRGKGSVSRLPSLADNATQPFKEEKIPIDTNRGR
ncbi:hypothetical protein LXL04_017769 [Taraxacum kok-saghyz]